MLDSSLTDVLNLLPAYALPFCRIIALFSSAPIVAEKVITLRLRIALALLLTGLLPMSVAAGSISLTSLTGLLLMMREIVIGFALGVSMQFIFAAIRLAGEVIALQMGLSFASFFDIGSHSTLSVVSRLITNISLLLFISVNGLLGIVEQLAQSFQQLPCNSLNDLTPSIASLLSLAGIIFSQALQFSLPLIFLLVSVNFALGLLNRMAPQFSAFVIGFPLTLLIGIVALYYSMPLLITVMQTFMTGFTERLIGHGE